MKVIGIYQIQHIVSNNRYVGSSVDMYYRFTKHRWQLNTNIHHCAHLQNAWNKYGKAEFVFSVIEICDESVLVEREQYYFDLLSPEYNSFKEAGRGVPHTEETKKRIGEAQKKRPPMSEETKEKIRQAKLGKPRSEETKQKLREAHLGTKASDETKLKMSVTRKGRLHDDDTKQKMSEAAMGHTVSEETREKLRQAHLGTTVSDETKKKMSVVRTGKKQSDDTRAKRSAAIAAWWAKKRATEH